TRYSVGVHPERTPRKSAPDAAAYISSASAHASWYGRRRETYCRTRSAEKTSATSAAISGKTATLSGVPGPDRGHVCRVLLPPRHVRVELQLDAIGVLDVQAMGDAVVARADDLR